MNNQSKVERDLKLAKLYANKHCKSVERGIEFNLTFRQYEKIMSRKTCYYTGVKFKYGQVDGRPHPHSPTLDRIDSTKGYTVDNTVRCTHEVNQAKNILLENNMCTISVDNAYKLLKKLVEV